MSAAMIVRGIAVPSGRTRFVGDDVEYVEPEACAAMAASRRIDVRFLTHDADAAVLASTSARTVEFFADEKIGLLFEARIPWSFDVGRLCASSRAQCSIGGLRDVDATHGRRLSMSCRVIRSATIDHVTLCDGDAAYGGLVPAWRVDEAAAFDAAPWSLRMTNEAFEAAQARHQARQRREAGERARAEASDRKAMAAWQPYVRGTPLAKMPADLKRAFFAGMRPPRPGVTGRSGE